MDSSRYSIHILLVSTGPYCINFKLKQGHAYLRMRKRRILRAAPLFPKKRPRMLSPESDQEMRLLTGHRAFSTKTLKCPTEMSEVHQNSLVVKQRSTPACFAMPEKCDVSPTKSQRPLFRTDSELDTRFESWVALALGHTSDADFSGH